MPVDDSALAAIRILIAVRDSPTGELNGSEISTIINIGFGDPQKTGPHMRDPRKVIKLLVRTGMLDVSHRFRGKVQSFAPHEFEETVTSGGEYGLGNFTFSVSSRLADIQNTLGVHSLTELEQRAMGNTISIQPVFGQVQLGFTRRFNDTIFVAMPFRNDLIPVFDDCIEPVVRKFQKTALRADNIFTERTIMSDVWHAIYSAYAIIIDCTGRNANVFYELGMAHTIGKKCIILAQDEEDIPFDINQFRYLTYSNNPDGLLRLQKTLTATLMKLVEEDEY